MPLIAPSILSADFTRLGEQIEEAEQGGADWIHVDVMDGHFVPNITIGPLVVEAARRATELPLDVHLMIEEPERYLADFVQAGANRLTVHQETCPHLHRTVQQIRELGALPGVAVNPATPVETLADILPFVDLVLVMSVNPGFGGQSYIEGSSAKVRRLIGMLSAQGRRGVEIEVDGGIDPKTAPSIAAAGATVLVAGSAIFGSGSISANIQAIRKSLAVEV
ncbi:MAG: ribulose-phosphate 3-epimerase [Gemmatimonadetes bacterium]|uniref:Ribulose-phosphate 3-epimerase n=1 Tax=Candidatus Kutchimonas denitrificans TaxID=3056748 RepID=A0AAE4Z908_9BACT|nr:ribulose-phosphate 3-epimerase [Gemmatimonadota bacterium]NIR74707.1 ribulose-phosphate 3-epimerase [Candidatus Kutchimonas denitrificans]NIS01457.1 ribulose-phosphate 3-epimerase [Gemmatimonadota bacterium]NIT67198.1 ribulose-phosphate 3-epimerase [Gemmatimonadota bacterium]NIU52372.1 ribulose-phosphate 3-epimerase [Gemmatimonadota bacterium]